MAKHSREGQAGSHGGIGLVVALVFVALAGMFAFLVFTGKIGKGPTYVVEVPAAGTQGDGNTEDTPAELEPKPFGQYTWAELSEISSRIAAAPTDEEGRAIAQEFGILDADGRLVDAEHELVLTDNTFAHVRVIGVRADSAADGSGVRGLTLMAYLIAEEPMNETPSYEGGGEGSRMRSWLADEGMALLPEDLSSLLVPVSKLTNNAGRTSETADVTQTQDALWLLSAHEVCGDVAWFTTEYGGNFGAASYDAVVNSEGTQYEWFLEQGVTQEGGPAGLLALTWRDASRPWWLRSPYPMDYTGQNADCFYQVSTTGYPASVGVADSKAGVCIGFCL